MLDKKTTAVVTAVQLFDILDHIHFWQLWNFLLQNQGYRRWDQKVQKYLAFFNMLFIRADFCGPLRFINSAILFIFLSFWLVVLLLIVSRFLHIKHWVFLKQRFFHRGHWSNWFAYQLERLMKNYLLEIDVCFHSMY